MNYSPQLDANHNPITPSPNYETIEIDANLTEKVRTRRQFIRQKGVQIFGTSPHCSPKTPPPWFDQKAFQRAQALYRNYGSIIQLSQFYGLLLVLNFYEGLAPLLVTGKSSTVPHLFTRYLSTSIHIKNWFTSDPFDPTCKSYRSLKIVRGLHQQVGRKLNQISGGLGAACKEFNPGALWMSQWGMCHAQFTFMGFMTVFPKTLGFHNFTSADFHDIFHFWRVIGYCLGIEDRFNLCSGSDDEIVEHCRQLYYEEWLPKIRAAEEPTGIAMAQGIVLAMFRIIPVATYNALMCYAATDFSLDVGKYRLSGYYWDYVSYATIWWTLKVIARLRLLAWLGATVSFLFERLAVGLRRFHVWSLGRRYKGDQFQYKPDDRCPFMVEPINYKTAWQYKLH